MRPAGGAVAVLWHFVPWDSCSGLDSGRKEHLVRMRLIRQNEGSGLECLEGRSQFT
jgi:hypothetical protein